MSFNTGNPLGSNEFKDLSDNAQNFDSALNAFVASWVDRFGRDRKTWYGFEQDFNAFLVNNGYEAVHLVYTPGSPLTVLRATQLIDYNGSVYRVKMPATLPVNLTGTWATDSARLVDIGDQSLRQALAAPGGAALIGDTVSGNVAAALAALRAADADLYKKVNGYASAPVTSGTVTLNPSTASTFGTVLSANVTTLNLNGAASGVKVEVDWILSQPTTGIYTVATPSNVMLPNGVTSMVSTARRGDITLCRLTTVDGGVTWLYERRAVYSVVLPSLLPPIADDNATFNDNATATTGWTNTNSTLTVGSGFLKHSKTAGGTSSSSVKAVTLPTANRDFIIYIKARASNAASRTSVIWLTDGTRELGVWFSSANGGDSSAANAMSITGYTTARQVAAISLGSVDYEAAFVEMALQYDSTFGTATLYFKKSDGTWEYKARVLHTWFAPPNIAIQTPSASLAGTYIDLGYLTVARPNIIALGDSIVAGSTGFNPNPSLSLTDGTSRWMQYTRIYAGLRNNLVVNKGRGGNTSAQMLARMSEVTDQGGRVLLLQASSNDNFQGVSQSTRTTTIQNIINAATAAGMTTALMNGLYGVAGSVDNTAPYDLRNYNKTWWETSRPTLTGVYVAFDVASAINLSTGYQDPALTQADKLHPNPAGYAAIGAAISEG